MKIKYSDKAALNRAIGELQKANTLEHKILMDIAYGENYIEHLDLEDSTDEDLNEEREKETNKLNENKEQLIVVQQDIKSLERRIALYRKHEDHKNVPDGEPSTLVKNALRMKKSLSKEITGALEKRSKISTVAELVRDIHGNIETLSSEAYRELTSKIAGILRTYENRGKFRKTHVNSTRWQWGLPGWWDENDKLDEIRIPKEVSKNSK